MNKNNSVVFSSALVSTCGIGAQLQSRGRLRQDELESLSSLWNSIIDDLHFYKFMPFAMNKMKNLCGQRGFRLKNILLLHVYEDSQSSRLAFGSHPKG